MNRNPKQLICLAGLSATIAFPVGAETLTLDEVVISAGRVPVESEKVGRAHSVISGAELESSQNRYVADALRSVPGLAVSRIGGLTQIRVRGSEANHVLVLIDGVEAAASSTGEYDFSSLQTADIERIEILRGPQSALYGSNATSGVIQIITKGGLRNDYQYSVKSELGSDNTVTGSLGVRGGGEDYDFAISGSVQRTGGFNISDFGSEDDGDRNATLNSKLNWDLSDDVALDFNFRYIDRDTDTDDQDFAFPAAPTQGQIIDTNSYIKTKEIYSGLGLSWSLLDGRFIQKTRAEITDLERRSLDAGADSGNDDRRYHFSHQGSYFFDTPGFYAGKHSVTGAFEAERESFQNVFPSSDSQRAQQTRDLLSYAAEYRGEFSQRLFVSAAVRHDDNDDFKDAFTYSASAAYLWPTTGTRLHGSFGKGVTNPSFYEQFGFIPASFQGNSQLKPEENNSWDIGIEQKLLEERLTLGLTYFNERLKNEISTQFKPDFTSTPVNLTGTSKRSGVEFSAQMAVNSQLFVKGSYTYLDASDPDGAQETRRPRHAGAINVSYNFNGGHSNVFLDAVYNGDMQDLEFINSTPQTKVTLDSYTVVNLGADHQLNDQVQVYGRIENLFDKNYQEVFGYNTQGLTGFIGLKANF